MKRRKFLRNSAIITAGTMMMPAFLKAVQNGYIPQDKYEGKRLIIVQLSGGNDGLNTVVPFENDIYYQERKNIAIAKQDVVKLTDDLGLNPALKALQEVWDEGYMSVVNSVGYPNPDRSHFRSMDIWQTASASNEYLSTGWLGRYLDQCKSCEQPHTALELDDQLSLVLKGQERSGFAMSNPKRLYRTVNTPIIKALTHHHEHEHHENVSYLYKTLNKTVASADYLFETSKVYQSNINYPQSKFAKDLKQTAELINAGCDAQVYYVTLGGFDTHAGQKNRQERLLKQYAEGVAAFVKDLKQGGNWKDSVLMTFSEFGRRVAENGSGGTDHGTANNLFLMSGSLQKVGFYNSAPNLTDLDKGDLKYEIDFRRVYASLLKDWLQVDAKNILGTHFDTLGIV